MSNRAELIASTKRVIRKYVEFNPELRAAIACGLFPDTNRSYLDFNLQRIKDNAQWLRYFGVPEVEIAELCKEPPMEIPVPWWTMLWRWVRNPVKG